MFVLKTSQWAESIQYNTYRINANFTLQDFAWLSFFLIGEIEWGGKTHPSEKQSSCPASSRFSSSHTKDQTGCRPRPPLGCQICDCYPSIQLVEVGHGITQHPGPELWHGFLDRCQMKVADMFGLLREKVRDVFLNISGRAVCCTVRKRWALLELDLYAPLWLACETTKTKNLP